MIVSNVAVDSREIGSLGNAEAFWHTDSTRRGAAAASCLYALEVPPAGGIRDSPACIGLSKLFRMISGHVLPDAGSAMMRDSTARAICVKCAFPEPRAPDRPYSPGDGSEIALSRTARTRASKAWKPASPKLLDTLWEYATSNAVVAAPVASGRSL
jgi:hypothetical protein